MLGLPSEAAGKAPVEARGDGCSQVANSGLRVQVVNDDQQCAAELNGPLGPSSRADHKHQSHPLKSMNLQSVEVEDSCSQ